MTDNYDPLAYLRFQQDQLHRLAEGKHRKEFTAQMNELIHAAQTQAEAAKAQSDLVEQKAKKADIKGVIALIISALALLLEVVINHREIIEFFKTF